MISKGSGWRKNRHELRAANFSQGICPGARKEFLVEKYWDWSESSCPPSSLSPAPASRDGAHLDQTRAAVFSSLPQAKLQAREKKGKKDKLRP